MTIEDKDYILRCNFQTCTTEEQTLFGCLLCRQHLDMFLARTLNYKEHYINDIFGFINTAYLNIHKFKISNFYKCPMAGCERIPARIGIDAEPCIYHSDLIDNLADENIHSMKYLSFQVYTSLIVLYKNIYVSTK